MKELEDVSAVTTDIYGIWAPLQSGDQSVANSWTGELINVNTERSNPLSYTTKPSQLQNNNIG